MTIEQSVELMYHDVAAITKSVAEIDEQQEKIVEKRETAYLDELQLKLQEVRGGFSCFVAHLNVL